MHTDDTSEIVNALDRNTEAVKSVGSGIGCLSLLLCLAICIIGCPRAYTAPLLSPALAAQIDFHPGEAIARITFTDSAVPRLRYAIELRDELRKRSRLCDHAEDWDATIRAIADGAELIEMAVCHHEKKTRRTLYRVAARWLTERDYPQASVLEGVERRR